MSLNKREINQLVGVARAYWSQVNDSVITFGDGSDSLGIADNDALAVLINRYYDETSGTGTPGDLSEG